MEATSYIIFSTLIDPDDCAAPLSWLPQSQRQLCCEKMAKAAMIINGVPDPRCLSEEGIWLPLEGEEGNLDQSLKLKPHKRLPFVSQVYGLTMLLFYRSFITRMWQKLVQAESCFHATMANDCIVACFPKAMTPGLAQCAVIGLFHSRQILVLSGTIRSCVSTIFHPWCLGPSPFPTVGKPRYHLVVTRDRSK